ncbi:abasic site processing protein HMCES-like [Bradysia coprophila]|nr:abasic site processing protein HMCES-like [Bradysia coprophila]
MCGRTCLTLGPDEVKHACQYKSSKDEKQKTPEFRQEFNCGKSYQPSTNICPTDVTPVLISSNHVSEEPTDSSDRVLVPMMWGMIPFWHTGDYKNHKLTTNNCRLETMTTSKMYKRSFEKGQRCVVVCEGFYEWQTTKELKSSERPAYYFYMPQNASVEITDAKTFNDGKDVNLLKMAGLFDVWTDKNGDDMYSYTVITFESDDKFSWLHHRSPAILETEEQLADWLDYKRVPMDDAMKCLRPATSLKWHQVSNIVNNSRNKSDECNKPIKAGKRKISNPLMDN